MKYMFQNLFPDYESFSSDVYKLIKTNEKYTSLFSGNFSELREYIKLYLQSAYTNHLAVDSLVEKMKDYFHDEHIDEHLENLIRDISKLCFYFQNEFCLSKIRDRTSERELISREYLMSEIKNKIVIKLIEYLDIHDSLYEV